MSISFACDACGKRLKVADKHAGRKVHCPDCQSVLMIPALPARDEPPIAVSSRSVAAPSALPRETAPPDESPSDDFDQLLAEDMAALPPRPEPRRRARPKPIPQPSASAAPRDYLYCALALALIPLAFSLFSTDDNLVERVEQTLTEVMERQPDMAVAAHEEPAEETAPEVADAEDAEAAGEINELALLIALHPEHKLSGAHLAADSSAHWLYAAFSAGVFLSLLTLMFQSSSAGAGKLFTVGLVTGTLGVMLLLAVQWLAEFSLGIRFYGRSIVTLILLAIKLIGYSYYAALNPENGFWMSAFGFTFGVGLCEEVVKALPIIWYLRVTDGGDWRGACLVGLASGVGFGVSEGIMYAGDMYNGVATVGIYFVRFISCVALHATWSGAIGLLMHRNQDYVHGDIEWDDLLLGILFYLGAGMVLHGLYDTLLKQGMNAWAMAIAAGSFVWLAWLIEQSRREFDAETA